jgi:glycosyltransferase involved in cell wall biosynthesis
LNKKFYLKVAFVDPRRWYSPNLLKSLSRLYPTLLSYIYLPKWSETTPVKKIYFNSITAKKERCNGFNVWSTYSYPFEIFKKAASDNVDLVHIQWELNVFGSFYASLLLPLLLLLLRILKVKLVVTVHSVIPRASFGLKLPGFNVPRGLTLFVELLFIMLYKLTVLLPNAIIVHGDSLKKLLCLDYKSKPEKIFVIPYGVESEVSSLHSLRKLDEISSEGQEIILAIGTISPRKGLDVLIKAFERLSSKYPSWKLVISGNVPSYYEYYYSHLKKLASSLIKQKRAVFLGAFSMSDVNRLLEASKVVVFPYIYNFGASSTLTFALQHRKVVVISALNFATDLLADGENALLIPPGNPVLLANAIERAMCNNGLRHTIQKGIDNLLQRSSWDFAANETLKVYNEALSGSI